PAVNRSLRRRDQPWRRPWVVAAHRPAAPPGGDRPAEAVESSDRAGSVRGRTTTRRHHAVPGHPGARLLRPTTSDPVAASLSRVHAGPALRSPTIGATVASVQDRCRRTAYRYLWPRRAGRPREGEVAGDDELTQERYGAALADQTAQFVGTPVSDP